MNGDHTQSVHGNIEGTAADVQRVARKYIPVDNAQIVAVGDSAKIREVLAKFEPVEEWNADGHKK